MKTGSGLLKYVVVKVIVLFGLGPSIDVQCSVSGPRPYPVRRSEREGQR